MGIIFAIGVGTALIINNKISDTRHANTKTNVYKDLGKRFEQNKINGVYENGKSLYWSEVRKRHQRIETQHNLTEKIIKGAFLR